MKFVNLNFKIKNQ